MRRHVPDPPSVASNALERVWGYASFRPGQAEVIAAVMEGRDALAVLPTGGGKSLTYQVPAVAQEGRVLVVSPLVALMQDQVQALERQGVRAAAVHSGLGRRAIEQAWTDAEFGRYRLLYVTPEQLQSEAFRVRAPRLGVTLLAIDEAHCISEWGHDFRPAYRRLGSVREHLGPEAGESPPVLAVTATATPHVRRDIIEQLGLRDPAVVVRGFDRPNLVWSVHHVQDPVRQALDVFRNVPGPGLLYAGTRRATEEWAGRLRDEGIASAPYHAGLDTADRERTLQDWLADRIRIVAATSAFGMGIDKPDVRAVVHTALPLTVEGYYQEAGRAGRDEKRAYAALVLGPEAERVPRRLVEHSHPTAAEAQDVYDAAGSLAQVAIGSCPEAPTPLDLARLGGVSGRPPGVVRQVLQRLDEAGVWSVRDGQPGRVWLRRASGLEETGGGDGVREFARGLFQEVRDEPGEWVSVSVDAVAKRLRMDPRRVHGGLDYLAARGVLEVLRLEAGVVIEWHHPRARRLPVDAASLEASRRRATIRLDDVVAYANGVGCRRRHLLAYFGEASPSRCGRCDVCLGRHRPTAPTPADELHLRRLLESVARGESVVERDSSRRDRAWVDWLVDEGYLRVADPLVPSFSLTPRGQRRLES